MNIKANTNPYMFSIAILIIIVFTVCVFRVVWHGIPKMTTDEAVLVGGLIGSMGTHTGTVISYYFGSSKSSRDKDEIMREMKSDNNH